MSDEKKEYPRALYKGKLPIGQLELECYVLNDQENTRIIDAAAIFQAFGRPRRGNRKEDILIDPEGHEIILPPFFASKTLYPLISPHMLTLLEPVFFLDGKVKKEGYKANILPAMCSLYLKARREGKLLANQKKLAEQAEILQDAFATVGIIALVDEATGFQKDRKYDALRLLLQTYIAEKIREWIKTFPDDFFNELDRLYAKETTARTRPPYYGRFINTYVYKPIEKGLVDKALTEKYKEDKKKHRKHQHLTDFGADQLKLQIGRITGIMSVAAGLDHFKQLFKRQKNPSLFPDIDKYEKNLFQQEQNE